MLRGIWKRTGVVEARRIGGWRGVGSVGIVGMGSRGSSLAAACLEAGDMKVNVLDTPPAVDKGVSMVEKILASKNVDTSSVAKISYLEDIKALAKASEFLVDALEKDSDTRGALPVMASEAAETVTIASCVEFESVSKMGSISGRATQLVGLHFFLDPHVSNMVEIVKGTDTSEESVQSAMMFVAKLQKNFVVVEDTPGFVSARLIVPYINEAVQALSEKVSSAEDIDKIMCLGTAEAKGPLALADEIGLDRCLMIMKMLHNRLGDDKYRPSPLLERYVDAKRVGGTDAKGVHDSA